MKKLNKIISYNNLKKFLTKKQDIIVLRISNKGAVKRLEFKK